MADYYLKTDNIMKNMFTVALKDELAAQSRMGTVHTETEAMLQNFAMPSIGCGTSILPWAGTATALTA